MNCSQHTDQTVIFTCAECKTPLCKKCKPVSFHGRILCPACCDKAEKKWLQNELRKQSAFSPTAIKRTVIFLGIIVMGYLAIYFFILRPREIKIPPDDRERLHYYLSITEQSTKGSETYNRQIQNIMKLSVGYRHVLAFLNRGKKHYAKGNYSLALEDFGKVKKMLPDWDGIYALTGECYKALHQIDPARRELKEAIDLNPESPKAYLVLGEIEEDENRLDEAILQYTKALFVSPKNGQVFLKLAGVYIKKKRYQKAAEFRDKAKEQGISTDQIDNMLKKTPHFNEEPPTHNSVSR
ncbi:MAG: tetratricopeptide repeat protein [Candidatus Aureabacteria bacterium]|nr:tetratricopeptide repeat protein [Candidatus Auribacterota bacterium]